MTRNDNKTKTSQYTTNQENTYLRQTKKKLSIPFMENSNITPYA
jgi:hypothetical protein